MTVLKCKMCGGDIELSADNNTYGTCGSCGSVTTLPKASDEQRVGLFDRGNALRMHGEFDKAAAAFEKILEIDAADAEAHWCLALCKYGIEYVEDPHTRERVPTCHRASYEPLLKDVDYLAAVEHSDSHTAGIYTAEAKKIAEIQKSIIAISKQEEPFDVFICYKETAADGSRTRDSVIAQEVYYELTNAGYKVFFSRITLEGKLGVQYEPYIFAALNSAKVMLVIGTAPEHFNAVWVRNEWSRFLSIMKNERGRMLIPCYRDMDPYGLPDELAMLQSQDMGKIGFIQDITRGIKKVLGGDEPKTGAADGGGVAATAAGLSADRLITSGNTFLKLNDYANARKAFDRAATEYPEDYRGWWGLVKCATDNLTKDVDDKASIKMWIGYARQLASTGEFAALEQEYEAYVKTLANADTAREADAINNAMNEAKAKIVSLTEKKKNTQAEIVSLTEKKKNIQAEEDEYIERYIKEEKKANAIQVLRVVFGVIFLVIGFFIFISWTGWAVLSFLVGAGLLLWGKSQKLMVVVFGVIFIVIGVHISIIWTGWAVLSFLVGAGLLLWGILLKSQKLMVVESEGAEEGEVEEGEQYSTIIKTIGAEVEERLTIIKTIDVEIAQAENRIANGERYLALDRSKIFEMFFALRCGKQPPDDTVVNLRKAVLGAVVF